MADSGSTDIDELIAGFQAASRARTKALRSITFILFFVVLGYLLLMASAVKDFAENRIPELTEALSREAQSLASMHTVDVQDMLGRVYPVYIDAFQQRLDSDLPELQNQAQAQIQQLDAYAQSRWPEIQEGLADIVLTQGEILQSELSTIVTPDQAKRISELYGEAVGRKYEELISTRFNDHLALATEVGRNLQRIVETEPDIVPPIEMKVALGMLLELIGEELQQDL